MDDWQSAFTEAEYDAIVLGTGLKECLISGLLSVDGKKVCIYENFCGYRCQTLWQPTLAHLLLMRKSP